MSKIYILRNSDLQTVSVLKETLCTPVDIDQIVRTWESRLDRCKAQKEDECELGECEKCKFYISSFSEYLQERIGK